MERDSGRTACHDSVIIKFNMLARYLKMQGRDTGWRDKLGYEVETNIRNVTFFLLEAKV